MIASGEFEWNYIPKLTIESYALLWYVDLANQIIFLFQMDYT